MYISEFFIDELRNYYTEQERIKFLKKVNSNKVIRVCEGKDSQVCFRRIHEYALEEQGQKYNVFKTEHPLKNIKLYHFHHNDTRSFGVIDRCYIGEKPKKTRANSDQQILNSTELPEKVQRIDSNMTTQGSDVDPAESLSHDLLIERQTHSCDLKEGIEDSMRRIFKRRAELMNEMVMLEQGTVQDSLDRLLAYQVKRREMPEWNEVELRFTTSKDEDPNQKGEGRSSPTLYPRDACDSDEEIEDNDMIEIMANNDQPLEPLVPEDGTLSTANTDSRRGTEMNGLKGFSVRDSEATDPNDDEEQREPQDNEIGFFGMEMQDSEEDGEGLLPHRNNYHSSRFSFLDSNLDKFTVLQFIENQALNISQVASNQKFAKKPENS